CPSRSWWPGRRRSSGSGPSWASPAWTSWSASRAWAATRCRSPASTTACTPSTWSPSTGPRCRWPPGCCACARCPTRPTDCPCSATSTGRRPSAGWRRSPTAGSPPSRRRPSGSPCPSRGPVSTAGPAAAKGFTVRAVVALAQAKKARILLAAPTGRAAKRLSELAGMDAQTLHRLLELRPGGEAAFHQDRPLEADLVVVDEASMLDLLLANKLVKAVPPGAHLLLVGDVDQLPSVGPGEVLRDLLQAGGRTAPVLPRV